MPLWQQMLLFFCVCVCLNYTINETKWLLFDFILLVWMRAFPMGSGIWRLGPQLWGCLGRLWHSWGLEACHWGLALDIYNFTSGSCALFPVCSSDTFSRLTTPIVCCHASFQHYGRPFWSQKTKFFFPKLLLVAVLYHSNWKRNSFFSLAIFFPQPNVW